jgi:hypothetical protein
VDPDSGYGPKNSNALNGAESQDTNKNEEVVELEEYLDDKGEKEKNKLKA